MHSYAGVIPLFVSNILKQEPLIIHGNGNQTRDFTYVEEAIRAMIALSDPRIEFQGVVNIGTGIETSVLQIASMVIENMNVLGYPIVFTERRHGDVERHQADISKLIEIGVPPPMAIDNEQIAKTIDHYVTQAHRLNL